MNKLKKVFEKKDKRILNVYCTAGYPKLESTVEIINELISNDVDIIEIGMPFSDPLADGPVIQESSEVALKNGMTLEVLFGQLNLLQINKSDVPVLLMGYLNPVLQMGVENFCKKAQDAGVSGVIIPDLPMPVYLNEYRQLFQKYQLANIFLITPQTSVERIRFIDEHSDAFIYMVSSSSTTGTKTGLNSDKVSYFNKVKKLNLKNPLLVGFGINNADTFRKTCEYVNGAIIGTAFIQAINGEGSIKDKVKKFIQPIVNA